MEKIYAIIELLKLLVWLTKDDNDNGIPDLFEKHLEVEESVK